MEAVLAAWASPGKPFLGGKTGPDTVAQVTPTGAHAWQVAVIPGSGGAPVVWSFEVTRSEVYRTFPGDAFTRSLWESARSLGMRTFLPTEVTDALRRGDVLAVGDVEVRYGSADRSGRNTESRVVFLTPSSPGPGTSWVLQPASRSAAVLLQALQLVTDDMVQRDDRVLSCMGSGTPKRIPRSVQLECVGKAWAREFEAAAPGA